jgi:arsenate reductase
MGSSPRSWPILDKPPSKAALREIVRKLGLPVRALLRTGEDVYKELGLAESVPVRRRPDRRHARPIRSSSNARSSSAATAR